MIAAIAAIAVAAGLPVYTCNPSDFEGSPVLRSGLCLILNTTDESGIGEC